MMKKAKRTIKKKRGNVDSEGNRHPLSTIQARRNKLAIEAEFIKEAEKILSDPSVRYISLNEFVKGTKSEDGCCKCAVLNKGKALVKAFKGLREKTLKTPVIL
jgi:hypothetical protein